jgi:hypothetical protein
MYWDMTDASTGTLLTRAQADKWLHDVVTNHELMQRFYDDVAALSKRLNIHPRLQDVAALNQRDALINDHEVWPALPNSIRAWLVWVDDAEIPMITDAVISAVVAYYREETR